MTGRLIRTQNDRIVGGVCGGLGRFLGVDSVFVRLAFVLFSLAGGAGLLVYLVLLVVMPLDTTSAAGLNYDADDSQQRTKMLVGGGLILIGLWYLLGQIPGLAWLSFGNLWPLLLIVAGIVMLVGYTKNREF